MVRTDGRSIARSLACSVYGHVITKFLGWVDYHISLAIFRPADEKREKKEYNTRIEVGFNGRSIRAELFRRREKSRGNRGFVSV